MTSQKNTLYKHWIPVLGTPKGCPKPEQFLFFEFDPPTDHSIAHPNVRHIFPAKIRGLRLTQKLIRDLSRCTSQMKVEARRVEIDPCQDLNDRLEKVLKTFYHVHRPWLAGLSIKRTHGCQT